MKQSVLHRLGFGLLLVFSIGIMGACGDPEVKTGKNKDASSGDQDVFEFGDVEETVVEPAIKKAHDDLLKARCQMLNRCCNEAQLKAEFNLPLGVENCEEISGAPALSLDVLHASQAHQKGSITFNGGMVTVCIEEFLKQECADWTLDNPETSGLSGCSEIYSPGLDDGADCFSNVECKSGYCDNSKEQSVCTRTAALGEKCGDTLCGTDGYCHVFTEICIERLPMGATCMYNRECLSEHCNETATDGMVCGTGRQICKD